MAEQAINQPAPMVGSTQRRRVLTVVTAALGAFLVWAVVELGFGYDLQAPAMGDSPAMDIGLWEVLAASLGTGLLAWAVLAAVERWTSRPRLIWTVLALVAFVVSLGGPLGGAGVEVTTRGLLVLLHLAVAAILIPGLAATLPRTGR